MKTKGEVKHPGSMKEHTFSLNRKKNTKRKNMPTGIESMMEQSESALDFYLEADNILNKKHFLKA